MQSWSYLWHNFGGRQEGLTEPRRNADRIACLGTATFRIRSKSQRQLNESIKVTCIFSLHGIQTPRKFRLNLRTSETKCTSFQLPYVEDLK